MTIHLTIRSMQPEELSFSAECTRQVEWVSEDLTTFEGFYQHDPQGCLIALVDEQPAGICVATSYKHSGFIGELIVLEALRGQGIGTSLLNRAVSYLLQRGANSVYLDGVLKAVPLYERNGFRRVCRSWRYYGSLKGKAHPGVRPMRPEDLPQVMELDHNAFGADRGFFIKRRLQLLPHLCKVVEVQGQIKGFILGRQGEGWLGIGPWIADPDSQTALRLLEALVDEVPPETFITIGTLAANTAAMAMIESLGMERRENSPCRMVKGTSDNLGGSTLCLAVGTAAKG